jgi:tetratricopeptide (TPR) repeat protein
VLKNLTENIFPKQEKPKDDSLSLWEKVKLGFYRTIFSQQKGNNSAAVVQETLLGKGLKAFIDKILSKGQPWEGIQQDFEDLEARNQKQVDKLMDLLKKNPDEALKYAIPLDENGTTRGTAGGQFTLSKRWLDFSLFGSSSSPSTSGTVDLGDNYYQLQNQYIATAEELLKKNEYQKAAFIFMKLLKNYERAAGALEAGRYYQEAATIYVKHSGNKLKAAECYEKGNLTREAIELYKELNDHEKAGDLYIKINKHAEAMIQYDRVVNAYKASNQYVKASLLCREKMNDPKRGQLLLIEGWDNNHDASNCLRTYLSTIEDTDQRWKEITSIYTYRTTDVHRESFLEALKYEFRKKNELSEQIREMVFEVVATHIKINPSIVSELRDFNPNNTELRKDAIRFKMKKK